MALKEKEDQKYLDDLLGLPECQSSQDTRCPGPNAEHVLAGRMDESGRSRDALTLPFESLSMSASVIGLEDEAVKISRAKRIVRPVAIRLGGHSMGPPSTPLSERSVSASLEDGSSSVSSFSTLPSSISSPDSSKLADIMLSIEKSAFTSLRFGPPHALSGAKTSLLHTRPIRRSAYA